MERLKKLFRAFALLSFATLCAALISTGALTARARTEKIIGGSQYAVAVIKTQEEKFEIAAENNEILIKIPAERFLQKLKVLLPFTPAGAIFAFFETVFENR